MNIFSLHVRDLILILTIVVFTGCEKQNRDNQINPVNVNGNKGYPVKAIALTFDDGPDNLYTGLILDILKEKDVKATFFLVGNKIKENKKVASRIFTEGHCIANHTSDHSKLPGKSLGEMYKNIMKTEKIIDSICGKSQKIFRPPWGLITKEQKNWLSKLGFNTILWNIDSKDYSVKYNSEMIVNKVIREAQKNRIILLHSADYAGKQSRMNTVQALPRIIDILRKQGYVFVKVDEFVDQDSISLNDEKFIPEEAGQ